jgi:hypothetical protein
MRPGCAAMPPANCGAAPNITGRRSPRILNTARYAWIVLRNGARAIPIIRGGTACNTLRPPSGIAGSSKFGTKNSDSSGSCHPLKAAAFRRNRRVPPVAG